MRRVVFKLAAAFVLASWLVLGLFTYFDVKRERARFQTSAQRTAQLVAQVLAPALSEVWTARGEDAGLQFVAQADRREDGVRIRWVWADAPPGDPFAPDAGREALRSLSADHELAHVAQRPGGGARVYTYLHVPVPSPRVGALEVVQSNREQERYIEATLLSKGAQTLAIAVANGLIAVIFGAWLVGRPVLQLVRKTRRIAAGDLRGPLALQRGDELGDVAREIDLMCEKLAAAQERARADAEARIHALEELRHTDRLHTVGQLAAGIAHELGTPLSVVSGRARMILRSKDSTAAHPQAEIIVRETERISNIIAQLLDFARKRPAERAPVELAPLLREVVTLLEPLAHKEAVTLTVHAPEAPVIIAADAGRLQQVFTNLVVNGLHAMKGRPGSLDVRLARVMRASPGEPGAPRKAFAAITFEDHGAGIAPEHLGRIFEPFFTTKEVGEGTGLGLSVSLGIVEEHGGAIDVTSEPSVGTKFTVVLPLAEAQEARPS